MQTIFFQSATGAGVIKLQDPATANPLTGGDQKNLVLDVMLTQGTSLPITINDRYRLSGLVLAIIAEYPDALITMMDSIAGTIMDHTPYYPGSAS